MAALSDLHSRQREVRVGEEVGEVLEADEIVWVTQAGGPEIFHFGVLLVFALRDDAGPARLGNVVVDAGLRARLQVSPGVEVRVNGAPVPAN